MSRIRSANDTREDDAGLTVRRYRRGDLSAIVELHNEALDRAGAPRRKGDRESDFRWIERDYIGGGGEFLVGELNGRVVAMGGLQRVDEGCARIRRMRVGPDLQRCGFGRAILRRLETRARELGYSKLVLDTSYRLTGALKFYPRFGYRKVDEVKIDGDRLVYFEKLLA